MKVGCFNQIVVYSQSDAFRFKRNKFQTLLNCYSKLVLSRGRAKNKMIQLFVCCNTSSRTINRSHTSSYKRTPPRPCAAPRPFAITNAHPITPLRTLTRTAAYERTPPRPCAARKPFARIESRFLFTQLQGFGILNF